MPLLSLSRGRFDYVRESLLRDVTLDVEPGEKVALIGINGSGKSTLLRIIAGEVALDDGERHVTRRARIVLLPQETTAEGDGTLLDWVDAARGDLGAVRRELEGLQARLEAGERLAAEELQRYGELQHRFEALGGWQQRSSVEAALAGLGFSAEDLHKPLRVLSGGERRRAALAAVLLQGGDLLLLDEPTNHLDLDAREWLQEFVRQSASAMLVVSHDRYFLDHTVTSVWHLSRATVRRWTGNYSQFVRDYEAWVTQEETAYNRQQHEIRKTEEFIRRNIAGQRFRQAQSRRKRLAKLERLEKPREERTRFKLRLRSRKRGGDVVLTARGLQQRFGSRLLFADLDVDLARGDKLGIIGPNGSGKTTLLKILARRLAPDAGQVRLGSDIDMGYFDQDLDFVGDAPTLMEEIWRVEPAFGEEQIRAHLGAFGFGADFVDRPVRALSGGQRNRLGLLELVLRQHNFLVLDEPTNHLDLDAMELVEEGLREFPGTLLLVSHDRQLLTRAVHKLLVLSGGGARLFHGGYEEYVESLQGTPLWSEIAVHESERRRQQERRLAAAAAGAARPNGADGSAGQGKREPERRVSKNTVSRLKRELEQLETSIVALEVDIEEIETALADPGSLGAEAVQARARAHAEKKQALAGLYERWNVLTEEIDDLARELQKQARQKGRR